MTNCQQCQLKPSRIVYLDHIFGLFFLILKIALFHNCLLVKMNKQIQNKVCKCVFLLRHNDEKPIAKTANGLKYRLLTCWWYPP